MNILSIDPGNIQTAFVVFDGENILDKGILPNEQMLEYILRKKSDYAVIEMIASYGMTVGKTVFDTVLWIGRFFEAAHNDKHTSLIYRQDIKMHLCKTTRAKDSNIRQALIDRFNPELAPGKRPNGILSGFHKDEWAALAVAVTFYDLNLK